MYTDLTILTKGKYKAWRLGEVPSEYLLTIHDNGGGSDTQLKEYIISNLEKIKNRIRQPLPETNSVKFICDKKTFPTKKDALNSLNKIRQKEQTNKKPIRAYECPECSGWHLTSMDYEVFKEIKK